MGAFKSLKQEDFSMKIVKDLGMEYATETSKTPQRFAIFECGKCGSHTRILVASVKNGNTKHCSDCGKKSGVTHGQSHLKGYKQWEGMIARCTNQKHKGYRRYGGRGIKVYEEWLDNPKLYIDYISSLPNAFEPSHSIDRINNDENYCPGNLRWASKTLQSNNSGAIVSKSKYKGVSWDKVNSKWKVRLMVNGKRVLIGYYFDELEAAVAYDNYIKSINLQDKLKNEDIYEEVKNRARL